MLATSPALAPNPTVLAMKPSPNFMATPFVQSIADRALNYLNADFPVHLRGPAGVGKTTLALHIAARRGRPVMLLAGDEEFSGSDLIGSQNGYRYRRVVDRFIHSVLKYEEDAVQRWVDHRLTTACRQGFTLIYDEYSRSRPEANNVLLSILEEQLLILPGGGSGETYIKVHPQFRIIFTSNPAEYAGVHLVQDALLDRMITLDLDFYDHDTEVAIATAQSGLAAAGVTKIVRLVRAFRETGQYTQTPTMRASIMIARIAAQQGLTPSARQPAFVEVCLDVLLSRAIAPGQTPEQRRQQRQLLLQLIKTHCR